MKITYLSFKFTKPTNQLTLSLSLPQAMDEEVSSQKLPQHHAYFPATVPLP